MNENLKSFQNLIKYEKYDVVEDIQKIVSNSSSYKGLIPKNILICFDKILAQPNGNTKKF